VDSWLTRAIGAGCVLMSLVGASAQESPSQTNRQTDHAGLVKIEPATLDFGTQSVGTATPPETATLTNTGTLILRITDIVTSGIDFSQTNGCGQTLAPAATCTVQITFKPATTGPRVANLQILDSDPASPQSVVLNGIGK